MLELEIFMTNKNQPPNIGQLLEGIKEMMTVASEALNKEGANGQDLFKGMGEVPTQLRDLFGKATEGTPFSEQGPTEAEIEAIREQQKAELLNLPLEFLEEQVKNWSELVAAKKEMESPEYLRDKLVKELTEVGAEIQELNLKIPDLLIKDTRLANQAFAKMATLVNVKKALEIKIAALNK